MLVYDDIGDPTPTVFADLRSSTHDFWDRGMLGLALHPSFPSTPYVYVLYTHGTPLDGSLPSWGDSCPDPPGATNDGCVVSARLSRLTASGNQATFEQVLINDWCAQYPSHTIGDLEFGADGMLYVSGGDGASFGFADYGHGGGDPGSPTPENPCGDPPVPVGGDQQPPSAEGGALRSQDLRTSGDPVSLDGTILRVDPITGDAASGNPLINDPDPNAKRIVAYGLRNPFRMTFRPGSNDLYIGDVGWGTWEEVNRHPDPTGTVRNFGWPCYEGGNATSTPQGAYDALNLTICENLYSTGPVHSSLFAYNHGVDLPGNGSCPPNINQTPGSSTSGLVFYGGGDYPAQYSGALFGADYSRGCIWVMYPGAGGVPDPSTIEVFDNETSGPVDLEVGPGGDVFYLSIIDGSIHRIRFGPNQPPTAVIDADPANGPAPLTVDLEASGSFDPDGDPLTYAWDLDNDGQFDDGNGVTAQRTFTSPGSYTVRLQVSDPGGLADIDSGTIQVSNSAPTATIDTPSPNFTWRVGELVSFSGHATDPQQGNLPASALEWDLVLQHCEGGTTGCHAHFIQHFDGVASGSFNAPDHEYPSWLELTLTATDEFGVTDSTTLELHPETVDLTFDTDPLDLMLSIGGEDETTPLVKTVIINSLISVGAISPQQQGGQTWTFSTWSDGGAQAHEITAPAAPASYTATFISGSGGGGGGGGGEVLGITTFLDTEGNIHEANILLIAAAGITQGCSLDGLFYCPDRSVTRTEMAVFVVRALGLESGLPPYRGIFPDVAEGSWGSRHVEKLWDLGIVKGFPDGTYRGGEVVTRAQMAVFLVNAFGQGLRTEATGIFADLPESDFFAPYAEQIYHDGVSLGCATGPLSYCPSDDVLRDQMASFLARALGLDE